MKDCFLNKNLEPASNETICAFDPAQLEAIAENVGLEAHFTSRQQGEFPLAKSIRVMPRLCGSVWRVFGLQVLSQQQSISCS
jgi:hypothetical protein